MRVCDFGAIYLGIPAFIGILIELVYVGKRNIAIFGPIYLGIREFMAILIEVVYAKQCKFMRYHNAIDMHVAHVSRIPHLILETVPNKCIL